MILGLTAVPVWADLYSVSGIRVDVEAENAVKAKEKALSDAAVQAFPKLFDRLVFDDTLMVSVQMPQPENVTETDTPVSDMEQTAEEGGIVVPAEKVASFVQGVSVSGEKNTATRYIADVTIQFKPDVVQNFLTENNVAFLDKEPPQMVVVPIFRENGFVKGIEEANPLWQSLKKSLSPDNLHHFVVPPADMTNVELSALVISGQDDALNTLIDRYQTSAAVIMDVTKNGATYMVKTVVYPPAVSVGSEVSFAVSSNSVNTPAVLTQIVKKTVSHMDRKFKAYQSYRTSARSGVTAMFEVASLSEWTAMAKKITELPFVEQTDVRAIYKNQIYAELGFSENTHTALSKMANFGLLLIPQGQVYIWQRLPIY